MRKRTAAAGVGAVGLAAYGLWMLPDLGDFGLGGDGTVAGITLDPDAGDADDLPPAPPFDPDADEAEAVDDAGPAVAADDATPLVNPAGTADPTPDAADAPPIAVADVLVDGGEYWVLRRFASDGREIREPTSAEEVVAMAGRVPGDPDGVKVRVARTPGAEAGAAADLMAALAAAGLADDEIDYRTRLVDRDSDFGGRPSDPPGRDLP